MQFPNQPSIQIVQLTRGSVVIAGPGAYACTDARDVLMIVASLLPPPEGTTGVPMPPDGVMAEPEPEIVPEPVAPTVTAFTEEPLGAANPLFQRANLLRLCDAWVQDRISDEQFDEYLAQVCPDITQDEAYMTRDSFGEKGAETSQLSPEMVDGYTDAAS